MFISPSAVKPSICISKNKYLLIYLFVYSSKSTMKLKDNFSRKAVDENICLRGGVVVGAGLPPHVTHRPKYIVILHENKS